MKKKWKLKTCILTAVLTAALAVTVIPAGGLLKVQAAESDTAGTSTNALKAIGIHADQAPEGFDANDTESNPYGKKTIVGTVSDEVYVATSGKAGSALIGNQVSGPTGSKYTYTPSQSGAEGRTLLTYQNGAPYTLSGKGLNTVETKYISEIAVAADRNSDDTAKKLLTDAGYSVIDRDLNDGAGGDYIFMGYKTTVNVSEAITGILIGNIEDKGSNTPNPPSSFTYNGKAYDRAKALGASDFISANGDLNHHTGNHTQYIYAYYTKAGEASASKPIYSITVNGTQSGSVGAVILNTMTSFDDSDLNRGAGGSSDDLYIHTEKYEVGIADVEGTVSTQANPDPVKNAQLNKTAGGNFDGNTEGKKSQFAMVSFQTGKGLCLSVIDAVGRSESKEKVLTDTIPMSALAGSYFTQMNKNGETCDTQALQTIANMSIVTGDFDGNGIDEIAVFNPKSDTGSRVEIYGLKADPDECDIYSMDNWEIKNNLATAKDMVVSLAAGDVNQDGTDDLVIGCGSGVTICHGARTASLSAKESIDMTFKGLVTGSETVIDPSVTVIREKVGGKMHTYLGVLAKSASAYNRSQATGYLMVLQYDGIREKYEVVSTREMEMNSVYTSGNTGTSNYAMLPLPLELYYVNHRFMSPYFGGKAALFSEGSLTEVGVPAYITYQKTSLLGTKASLIPYDFQVADLNGIGTQTVFYKAYATNYITISDGRGNDGILRTGHYLGAASPGSSGPLMPLHFSDPSVTNTVYAVLNTDDDTAYTNYTGKHYFDYSDPEVLAVLSSPPYFKDLLANDELSGNYAESTTAYGKTEGSSESISASATISAGTYVRVEQELSILGVGNVAQMEAELSVTASLTTEYEQESEINYSVEYSTSAGADAVVFYSIPTEIYEYETTYVDAKTGEKISYTKQMFFPKNPCVTTIELEKYNAIAANYSELPKIGEGILDHKAGYPETYPSGSGNYRKVKEFKGNWMGVDFTSAGGGITQSQTIDMSNSRENAFSSGVEISYSAGSGAGGVTVGYTVGSNITAGYAMTNTSGNSFTATMQNMPAEAEEYGYGLSWKLFAHEGSYVNKNGNTVKFPVVDYLVTDVMNPPTTPEEFRQNYPASTPDSIALEWEYDDPSEAEEFNIYRVTNINGRKTSILAGSVAVTAGTEDGDTYHYSFTDDGSNDDGSKIRLAPGVEYGYYIEAARSLDNPPNRSMPCETISAYTRSEAEYPVATLKGVNNNALLIFPDRSYSIQVNIDNKDSFEQIVYQWQKYDIKKGWVDLAGNKTNVFEIENATVDMAGEYRCLVDAIFYNEDLQKQTIVSTATDPITVTYKMRSVVLESLKATSNEKTPEVEVTFKPANQGCFITPSGNVRFVIEKDDIEKAFYAPLTEGPGRTATARLSDAEQIPQLEDGNYKVTVFYGGDEVFGSYISDVQNLVIGDDAIYPVITNVNGKITSTFAYGDDMRIDFYRYYKDETGNTVEEPMVDETNEGGFSARVLDAPGIYTKDITVKLAQADEEKTFTYSYAVTKRPVEIGISHTRLSVGDIEGKLPKPELMQDNFLATEEEKLSDLVDISFMNATKTQNITLNNDTPTGTYYAILTAKNTEPAQYYELELNSSEIVVGARVYEATVEASAPDDKQAGTVTMTSPEKMEGITNETLLYEQGANVTLTAKAMTGYKFDHWEITRGGKTTEDTRRTISMNMPSEKMSFKAVFTYYSFRVTIDESLSNGGEIKLPEGFVSGESYQVGTKFTFTGLEGEDSVPDYWIRTIGSKTTQVAGATIELTVPEANVTLYPVFKGKPYKVEIGEGVIAEYSFVDEQEDSVTVRIQNGDMVPKNSNIQLRVGNRYTHYMWFVNDKEIGRNKDVSFELTGESRIEIRPIEAANKPAEQIAAEQSAGKVSDVKLPDGWEWDKADANKVLAAGQEVLATAVYTGADKDQYENTTVVIRLSKKTEDKTEPVNPSSGDNAGNNSGADKPSTVTPPADGKDPAKSGDGSEKKPAQPQKGSKLTSEDGKAEYVVISDDGQTPAVAYKLAAGVKDKTVKVSSSVTVDNVTYKVTAIAANAFKGNKKVKSIVLPSGITEIGDNAFSGCTALTKIVIPAKVTKLGANLFKGNKKLQLIQIKTKKLKDKTVAKKAFKGVGKKVVVKVPKSKKAFYTKLFRKKGLIKKVKITK